MANRIVPNHRNRTSKTKKIASSESIFVPLLMMQRRQLVLNFIHEYRRIHEVSPRYDEITVGVGYSRTAGGTAFGLVKTLIDEGWLRRVAPGARMILPTRPATDIYCEITDPNLKLIAKKQRNLRILRRL